MVRPDSLDQVSLIRMLSVFVRSELDREEKALQEGTGRGLGLRGEWEGDPSWYGGKIRQIASVVETSGGFAIRLRAMMKRKSNRFARYLGSRRMLQVKLPEDKVMRKRADDVRKFMLNKFVLCGRVFVPFAAKEGKVFLMETNEDYERTGNGPSDRGRISVEDFMRWHNPMDLNGKQVSSSFHELSSELTCEDAAARDEVGYTLRPRLVRHGPGARLQGPRYRHVHYRRRRYVAILFPFSHACRFSRARLVPASCRGSKAPTEKILTDGCGFMNWAALASIARAFQYSHFPTAVQGRIEGSKGVWALHPDDRSPDAIPKIWTRPSQTKIKHDRLEPAHLIFELVAPPRVSAPSRLSRHTLMVLSHNGVPDEVIKALMAAGIDAEVQALSMFDNPPLLYSAVAEVGRIFPARLQRLASGSGRALGLGRDWGQEIEGDVDDEDVEHTTSACLVDRNECSGEPIKVHERVAEMLMAGFKPLDNEILLRGLRDIIKYRITELIREYHITVPKSADAFIIPGSQCYLSVGPRQVMISVLDPYGVLRPGEIHFKASDILRDPLEGPSPNIITGDVLVSYNSEISHA